MYIDELNYLIDYMIEENEAIKVDNPHRYNRKKDLFRILCNTRPPKEIDENFLKRYNKFLDELNNEKDFIDVNDIKTIKELYPSNKYKNSDKIAILKADITAIKIDAIVNSATHSMKGCFIPLHRECVDSAIHFFAGIELKNECVKVVRELGKTHIQTGKGIVTNAYHLPCKKIIHMVVHESNGFPKEEEYDKLVNIYIKSLKKLIKNELRTIAICSLGTGMYKFPKKETLTRVLSKIDDFLNENRDKIDKIVLIEYTLENFKILEKIVLENSSENEIKEKENVIPRTAKILPKKEKEKIKQRELEEKKQESESGSIIINEMVNRLSGINNVFVNQDYIRKADRPKYEKIVYTLLPEEEIVYDDDSFLYEKKKKRRRKKQDDLHKN